MAAPLAPNAQAPQVPQQVMDLLRAAFAALNGLDGRWIGNRALFQKFTELDPENRVLSREEISNLFHTGRNRATTTVIAEHFTDWQIYKGATNDANFYIRLAAGAINMPPPQPYNNAIVQQQQLLPPVPAIPVMAVNNVPHLPQPLPPNYPPTVQQPARRQLIPLGMVMNNNNNGGNAQAQGRQPAGNNNGANALGEQLQAVNISAISGQYVELESLIRAFRRINKLETDMDVLVRTRGQFIPYIQQQCNTINMQGGLVIGTGHGQNAGAGHPGLNAAGFGLNAGDAGGSGPNADGAGSSHHNVGGH